jgi:hypothetical protein
VGQGSASVGCHLKSRTDVEKPANELSDLLLRPATKPTLAMWQTGTYKGAQDRRPANRLAGVPANGRGDLVKRGGLIIG